MVAEVAIKIRGNVFRAVVDIFSFRGLEAIRHPHRTGTVRRIGNHRVHAGAVYAAKQPQCVALVQPVRSR
ncbi:hypothetical protein P910_001610 [Xylella fastidiosa Mul-MD]|nr:hypothetical protein P910_001610 [Xylella fastidiosa Mul-MD]